MNIHDLETLIVNEFSQHWELNDKAHRMEHFHEVWLCGRKINNDLSLRYPEEWILFAAYFHDLFAWSRANHHELSRDFILNTDHPFIVKHLNSEARYFVGHACGEHRASFKGEFTTKFSELVNSADRGFIGDVIKKIARSHLYWEKHFPDLTAKERNIGVIKHIKEKFGTGGYARYPEMYKHVFGEELDKQRLVVDNLKVEF